jgi:selenocysteine lyase/cysteine desulfurase
MGEIMVGTGATGVISGIIWPFFNKGDEVVVFSTIEAKTLEQFRNRGFNIKQVSSTKEGLVDYEDLESKISQKTRLVYFDNPSLSDGKNTNTETLVQLASIVRNHEDLFVICNESHFSNMVRPSSH